MGVLLAFWLSVTKVSRAGLLNKATVQVLEVLADDSNFRRMAMRCVAGPAAAMLTMPPAEFESAWCAGDALSRPDRAAPPLLQTMMRLQPLVLPQLLFVMGDPSFIKPGRCHLPDGEP